MPSSYKSVFAEMQKELMSAISESSARLAGAWMDALTRASELMAPGDRWVLPQAFSPPQPSGSLSKMIAAAAADLPGLVSQETNRKEVRQIKRRWLEYYDNLVCDTFGIPSRSQAQRVADQWRGLLNSLSHGSFTAPDGLPLLFSPAAWTGLGWPFPGGERLETGLFDPWVDAYKRAFQELLLPHRKGIARDHEKKVRRAFEAQVKLLDFLPEFHEQLMTAARRGLENVLQSVTSTGATEITPEVYRDFFKTWIANHEKEFTALFLSESFMQGLSEVVRLAGTARERMDSLMTTGLSTWDIASRKELEEIRQVVESLRTDVRELRDEVDRLRSSVERQIVETKSGERRSERREDLTG